VLHIESHVLKRVCNNLGTAAKHRSTILQYPAYLLYVYSVCLLYVDDWWFVLCVNSNHSGSSGSSISPPPQARNYSHRASNTLSSSNHSKPHEISSISNSNTDNATAATVSTGSTVIPSDDVDDVMSDVAQSDSPSVLAVGQTELINSTAAPALVVPDDAMDVSVATTANNSSSTTQQLQQQQQQQQQCGESPCDDVLSDTGSTGSAHSAVSNASSSTMSNGGECLPAAFFGVYDGHSGDDVAETLQEVLY
jgi:hypothetical protein